MCYTKIDSKTLDKIVKEAIAIEKGTTYAEIQSYEKKLKERHYEPIAYDQLEMDGT